MGNGRMLLNYRRGVIMSEEITNKIAALKLKIEKEKKTRPTDIYKLVEINQWKNEILRLEAELGEKS